MISWIKKIFPSRTSRNPKIENKNNNFDHYNSDNPISTKANDRFNRSAFSSRIAETLANRIDPSSIVIGLYGAWGDGKTSVLEMMAETLSNHQHVITIKFNPWQFQSEDLLLRGFFATLAQSLDKSLPNLKEKIGTLLTKYGSLLSLASVTIGSVVRIAPGDAAKGLGENLSSVGLDELRNRIDSILEKSGKRLVVLIDDIDRLDRTETHAIFKLVKLSASFRHTSYVMAFDDDVVAAALGERYGQGGNDAGREFLEKIIQVPLHLPPVDQIRLRQLVFEGVDHALSQAKIELTREMVDTFTRYFVDGLEHRLTTPRLAKLYSNALTFSLPLLKGEVNVVDLMLIEGVRILYPHLYATIRDNPDAFLKRDENEHRRLFNQQQPKSQIESLIELGIPGATAEERARVKSGLLENIFPRLKNTIYGSDWDEVWARKQKICTSEYFQRYFTYGIPYGDISDIKIEDFLQKITDQYEADQSKLFDSFSAEGAIPKLISKLRDAAETLPENQSIALLVVLAKNASLVPRERGPMVFGGTRMQCGILMSELLRRINSIILRKEIAETILTLANPIGFGEECLRWICHHTDRTEEKRILSDEDDEIIRNVFASRIQRDNSETPLYFLAPLDARALYWIWQSQLGSIDLTKSLLVRFTEFPNEVDVFLDCYVGEGWYVESGLPVRSDFDRRSYDEIANLIPPEKIAENIEERYGPDFLQVNMQSEQEVSITKRIAHQYLQIHNKVQKEKPDVLQEK